jgi:hypothetical protein
MSTKCGNYAGSGKNPLSESSINENGDRGDSAPSYKDYAGGRTARKPDIDSDLSYTDSGPGSRNSKSWQ